jgi:DNA polymerase III gamma/tau subunit
MTDIVEWYRLERPSLFKHMIGQEAVVKQVKQIFDKKKLPPHSMLLCGPTGTGKTTLARIIAKKLGATEVKEFNCAADSRGIDFIRSLADISRRASLDGSPRVFILDECHQITGDAQDAALKLTEDVPENVWYIFCSSEPEKLRATFRGRLTTYALSALTSTQLESLAKKICDKYGVTITDNQMERLVECARGSARQLIVILQQLSELDADERKSLLEGFNVQDASESLAKLLVAGKPWKEVAAVLKELKEEPEKVRRGILAYATAILLNQPADNQFRRRLEAICEAFRYDYFATGRSGLIISCFECCK